MVITRDGKQIELTQEEVELAYRERERWYHIEDVKLYCERNGIDISDIDNEQLDAIACNAENNMDQDDSYWEHYWDSFNEAIRDAMYFIEQQKQ